MNTAKSDQTDIKKLFIDWLTKRYKPFKVNNMFMALSIADEFLQLKLLSKKSVFLLESIQAYRLLLDLSGNKIFRFQHRKEASVLQKASSELRTFLKINLQVSDEVIRQQSTSTLLVEVAEQIEKNKVAEQKLLVDYDYIDSYAYTIPSSITYFGVEVTVSNWTMAYIEVCAFLYEDYPGVFQNLIDHPIVGTRRDFAKRDSGMTRPHKLFPDIWVEINLSVTDIVKRIVLWLDKCNVDYENLVIQYTKREPFIEGADNTTRNLSCLNPDKTGNEVSNIGVAKKTFEEWMIQSVGLAPRSAQSYSSAVKVAGECVVEFCIDNKPLYCMSESVHVQSCIERLFTYVEFTHMNESQHNRYRIALEKYLEYCRASDSGILQSTYSPQTIVQPSEDLSDEKKKQYAAILAENFPNGFRANAIYWARVRKYFSERYEECTECNEEITKYMEGVGVWRDGNLFNVTDNKENSLLEEIKQTVVNVLATKASCVYIESLFERYHMRLANELQIYTEKSMAEAVCAIANGEYIKRYNYFLNLGGEANTARDIIEYLKESASPENYDNIRSQLWFIPIATLKRIMTTTSELVRTAESTYMFAPSFPVSAAELLDIITLIHRELSVKSYLLDTRLRELIKEELPAVAINTESYSMLGWRNALGYLLRKHFSFAGRIISNLGEKLDMAKVYRGFAMERRNFTFQELMDFSFEFKIGVYYDALYEFAVRVSETDFVNRNQIIFPIDQIDAVLDTFCQDDYIAIKDITIFLHFPIVGYCWNTYLLESYVSNFSKRYCLIHQNFTNQKCYGAIVKRISSITNYDDLVLEVLTKSMLWSNQKSALQLLVDEGYQARKAYSGIDSILPTAKLRREKKKR